MKMGFTFVYDLEELVKLSVGEAVKLYERFDCGWAANLLSMIHNGKIAAELQARGKQLNWYTSTAVAAPYMPGTWLLSLELFVKKHPEWLVRADVSKLPGLENSLSYDGYRLLDIGNPELREFAAGWFVKQVVQSGLGGLSADNCCSGRKLNAVNYPRYPRWQYRGKPEVWDEALYQYLQLIARKLNAVRPDLRLWANLNWGEFTHHNLTALAQACDGIATEHLIPATWDDARSYAATHRAMLQTALSWWVQYPNTEREHILGRYWYEQFTGDAGAVYTAVRNRVILPSELWLAGMGGKLAVTERLKEFKI